MLLLEMLSEVLRIGGGWGVIEMSFHAGDSGPGTLEGVRAVSPKAEQVPF